MRQYCINCRHSRNVSTTTEPHEPTRLELACGKNPITMDMVTGHHEYHFCAEVRYSWDVDCAFFEPTMLPAVVRLAFVAVVLIAVSLVVWSI